MWCYFMQALAVNPRKMKLMEGSSGLTCPVCSEQFAGKNELLMHVRKLNDGSVSFKCDQCSERLCSETSLLHHKNSHEKLEVCICSVCKSVLRDTDSVAVHKLMHTTKRIKRCNWCTKAFLRERCLVTHKQNHPRVNNYFCINCLATFTTLDGFREHLGVTHQDQNSLLQCHICENQVCVSEFLDHYVKCCSMRSHEIYALHKESLTCGVCLKVLANRGCLKRHGSLHNPNMKESRVCEVCSQTVDGTGNIIAHAWSHYGKEDSSLPDSYQPILQRLKKFRRDRRHKRLDFVCEYCGKIYTKKASFNLHLLMHTGQRPFKCHICSKAFYRKSLLAIHMRAHTGERPYKCPFCSKTYTGPTALYIHRRTHNKTMPFVCPECDREFNWKYAFDKHMLTHKPERPFVCSLCPKTFSTESRLTKHMSSQVHASEMIIKGASKKYGRSKQLRDGMNTNSDEYQLPKNDPQTCPGQYQLSRESVLVGPDQYQLPTDDKLTSSDQYHFARDSDVTCPDNYQLPINNFLICPDCGSAFKSDKQLRIHRNECCINLSLMDSDESNSNIQVVVLRPSDYEETSEISSETVVMSSTNDSWNEVGTNSEDGDTDSLHNTFPVNVPASENVAHDTNVVDGLQPSAMCVDFVCSLCGGQFPTSEELDQHVAKLQDDSPDLYCSTCDMRFCDKDMFSAHQQLHSSNHNHISHKDFEETCAKENHAKCEHCGDATDCKHLTDLKEEFACFDCSITYAKLGQLETHVNAMHSSCKAVTCDVCKKRFGADTFVCHYVECLASKNNDQNLVQFHRKTCSKCNNTHVQALASKHLKESNFTKKLHTCEVCHKQIDRLDRIVEHAKSHYGPDECNLPVKYVEMIRLLGGKKQSPRGQQETFRCEYCGKVFVSKVALLSHVRLHTKVNTHVCQLCSKAFVTEKHLMVHVLRHTNEQAHECEQCLKVFTSSESLQVHKMTHGGPYTCPHCDKTLSGRSSYLGHIRLHTGERPYHCPHCSRAFTLKERLNLHMKLKHGTTASTDDYDLDEMEEFDET
ncbi:hypothetical protein PR048_007335 [Dryococelus australis]|uniref:C2H2-type domain-containing protein n=1 Tax=Dryococelus australis TaxID=614101 RepID=A0ABQ9IEM3_9NEOP|nr:hypothetical protein PR048_007335 [Dryococelus australis]